MPPSAAIVTVSLNPAIDRTIEVAQFTLGAHQVGQEIYRSPGGKGVNVSRALDRLGIRSVATGFLGEDNCTDFDPVFRKTRVTDQFFPLTGRTRENVTITDSVTNQETHIRDVGLPVGAAALEKLTRKLALLAGEESTVIFSGSLPPGISPDDFHRLVADCIQAGARVAVDTSGGALEAMRGLKLWLVKPNALELSELVGQELRTPDDRLAAARELARTVEVVLLTRGAEGACLVSGRTALEARVALDPRRVINTVGCGDTLLGAFVAGVWNELPLPRAFAWAVAAATASACTAAPAEFDPKGVDEFLALVELDQL